MLAVRVVGARVIFVMGGLVLGLGGKGAWGGAVHLAGVIRSAAQLPHELLLLQELFFLADLCDLGVLLLLLLSLLNRRHHSAQESAPAAIVQPLVALTDPAQHTGPLPVGVVVHRVAEGRAELGTRGAKSGDERTRGSLQVCLIRLLIAFTRPGLGGLDVVTEEEPFVRPEKRIHVVEQLQHLRAVHFSLGGVVGVEGIPDLRREDVRLPGKQLPPHVHEVVVHARPRAISPQRGRRVDEWLERVFHNLGGVKVIRREFIRSERRLPRARVAHVVLVLALRAGPVHRLTQNLPSFARAVVRLLLAHLAVLGGVVPLPRAEVSGRARDRVVAHDETCEEGALSGAHG
mmetsp:Transcript_12714/g.54608  ORF Transcript_12714/g.54608 Transcript_12714/m.54608 type:complete len:346 (-) Transcript_12714:2005-3042(-)